MLHIFEYECISHANNGRRWWSDGEIGVMREEIRDFKYVNGPSQEVPLTFEGLRAFKCTTEILVTRWGRKLLLYSHCLLKAHIPI